MLIAVCSLKGSPGVTTFSIALAARWPQPARRVLVECDPSGGDIAARFSLASSPGLLSLAAAARRRVDRALLWQHVQPLPGGLPVVVAPPGADQAYAALVTLPQLGMLGAAGDVVIADCGRVGPASPAVQIVRSADAMVLLSRAQADDLAHLVSRLGTIGHWPRRPALLLVGAGYPADEVERELGVPVLARIPDDRRGAAVLCGRATGRGPSRSPLGHTAARIGAALALPPAGHHPTHAVPGRATSAVLRSLPNPQPQATAHATAMAWQAREHIARNGSPT